MNLRRTPVALVATLAVSVLGLTACSSGSSTGTNASAPSAGTIDINAVSRDKLKQGGTLNWAVDQYSTQWNYNQVNGPEASTDAVDEAVMPMLYHVDPATQTPVLNTNYLTKAAVSTVGGKEVVTYDINPKATWSDGTPITYKDFAAEWTALNGANAAYNTAGPSGYNDIASVVAGTSDKQVVVTFSTNFGDWTNLFSPLYPAAYESTPALFNTGYLNKIPVTAGPFKIDKMDPTAQTVTVVRDPKWWGSPAILDKIVFRAMTSSAGDGAFANGEVDYVDLGPDASGVKQAQARSDGEVRKAAGPQFRQITFNGKSPLLTDTSVRQALFMGIDRQALASSDLKGLPWPSTTLQNHLFLNGQNGYQDNTGGLGSYNPTKAKALLDAAGWKMNGQYRQKSGKTLELTFIGPEGTTTTKNEATLVQSMYQAIGVKLDFTVVPSNDFFDKYVNVGKFDLTAFSWLGNAWPVSSNYSIYESPQGSNNFQNYTWIVNPQLDALLNKALADLDHTQAVKDANAADAAIWQEAGVLPLYQRPEFYGAKKSLANLGAPGDQQEIIYENIGFTS